LLNIVVQSRMVHLRSSDLALSIPDLTVHRGLILPQDVTVQIVALRNLMADRSRSRYER